MPNARQAGDNIASDAIGEIFLRCTPINLLPSTKLIAKIPLALGLENSFRGVFFTVPSAVAINKYLSSLNSRIGIMAFMLSPSFRGSRLIIGLPRAIRLAVGNS